MGEDTPTLVGEATGIWAPMTRVLRELDRMKSMDDAVFMPAMQTAVQVGMPTHYARVYSVSCVCVCM